MPEEMQLLSNIWEAVRFPPWRSVALDRDLIGRRAIRTGGVTSWLIPDLAEFSFELAPQKHQRLQIREEKNYVVFHHASNSHNDRKNLIEAPANLVLFSFTLNSEEQCPLFIR